MTANLDDFLNELSATSDPSYNVLDDSQNGLYIGIMSGTSLDALDLALCQFHDDDGLKVELIATHSKDFPQELHQILTALCTPNGTHALAQGEFEKFSELDFWGLASRLYGELSAQAVAELLEKANILPDEVVAIGIHGQTVRHRPEWRFSLQLLDPNILAERTGISVVSDFRRRDMAVGGQGAPLVPAFHRAVFGGGDGATVILNLGGIANITVLGDTVIGYDTGVANLLMDGWTARHLGQAYDKNGDWASTGVINTKLLAQLLTHPFLKKHAPKSTGREDFNLAWLDDILKAFKLSAADVQATLCEFTALTVAREVVKFAKDENNCLFVCGGGAYNTHLLDRLVCHLPNFAIATTEVAGISPTWVESVCFAWLARQTILGQPANLPSVTGADKEVVLGQVCFA